MLKPKLLEEPAGDETTEKTEELGTNAVSLEDSSLEPENIPEVINENELSDVNQDSVSTPASGPPSKPPSGPPQNLPATEDKPKPPTGPPSGPPSSKLVAHLQNHLVARRKVYHLLMEKQNRQLVRLLARPQANLAAHLQGRPAGRLINPQKPKLRR